MCSIHTGIWLGLGSGKGLCSFGRGKSLRFLVLIVYSSPVRIPIALNLLSGDSGI